MGSHEKSTSKLWFCLPISYFPHLGTTKKLNEIYFMYIKHHIKINRWYLLVEILKIDIKYTFLVECHIFSRNDRLFIYWCDVIARANMENYYQHIRWDKGLIKSKKQWKLYVSFIICLFFRPISALIMPTLLS